MRKYTEQLRLGTGRVGPGPDRPPYRGTGSPVARHFSGGWLGAPSLSLECVCREPTQTRCYQTNIPRRKEAKEDVQDKWAVVAEYPTTSGMATDVPDILDAMYRHTCKYMHASGLCMDENHVGYPTNVEIGSPVDTLHVLELSNQWLCCCSAGIRIVETHNSL